MRLKSSQKTSSVSVEPTGSKRSPRGARGDASGCRCARGASRARRSCAEKGCVLASLICPHVAVRMWSDEERRREVVPRLDQLAADAALRGRRLFEHRGRGLAARVIRRGPSRRGGGVRGGDSADRRRARALLRRTWRGRWASIGRAGVRCSGGALGRWQGRKLSRFYAELRRPIVRTRRYCACDSDAGGGA